MRTFDGIDKQRPGPANKSNQTAFQWQTLASRAHCLTLKQQMRPGIFDRTQSCQTLLIKMPTKLRASIGVFQSHAQRFQWKKQIAEQNRGIEIKSQHRTQGDLGSQLRP